MILLGIFGDTGGWDYSCDLRSRDLWIELIISFFWKDFLWSADSVTMSTLIDLRIQLNSYLMKTNGWRGTGDMFRIEIISSNFLSFFHNLFGTSPHFLVRRLWPGQTRSVGHEHKLWIGILEILIGFSEIRNQVNWIQALVPLTFHASIQIPHSPSFHLPFTTIIVHHYSSAL